MNRTAEIERKTNETEIFIRLNLDGKGTAKLDYPVGFMSHMLNTFARHGLFDIEVRAKGDIDVDQHHLVEDTGIVLGQCFTKALGEKQGIMRSGSCLFPMDETLACAAVDISGRPFLYFDGHLSPAPLIYSPKEGDGIGNFQTDVIVDFFQGFVNAAGCNLHLEIIRGRSDHHKIEALFKSAARALRRACEIDDRARDSIPSTKGSLPSFNTPGILV
jgi:imidazoleglycerol-phosphate dehydratase